MSSRSVFRFDSLLSTQVKLKELTQDGAESGTVVVARTQSAGRGTGHRQWHSPLGGLYFSALLSVKPGRSATDLSFVVSAATLQALTQALPKSSELSVKWPNDGLLSHKKIFGVLSEALAVNGKEYGIVGVGINVNIAHPELTRFQKNPFSATSLQIETGGEWDIPDLERIVFGKIFALYESYLETGFVPIRSLWLHHCAMVGKRVEIRQRESGVSVPGFQGTCLGIDDDGALMISVAPGECRKVYSGEVTCFWP